VTDVRATVISDVPGVIVLDDDSFYPSIDAGHESFGGDGDTVVHSRVLGHRRHASHRAGGRMSACYP